VADSSLLDLSDEDLRATTSSTWDSYKAKGDSQKIWTIPVTSMARVDMNNHFPRAYVRVTSDYFSGTKLSTLGRGVLPVEQDPTEAKLSFFIALLDYKNGISTLIESTRWYLYRAVQMATPDMTTSSGLVTLCFEFVAHPFAALNVAGVAGNDVTFKKLFWDKVPVPTNSEDAYQNQSLLGNGATFYGYSYINENNFNIKNGKQEHDLEALEACVIPPGVWTLEKACSIMAGHLNAFYKPLSGGLVSKTIPGLGLGDLGLAIFEYGRLNFNYSEYKGGDNYFQWAGPDAEPLSAASGEAVLMMKFAYRLEQSVLTSCLPKGFNNDLFVALAENTLLNNLPRTWSAPSLKNGSERLALGFGNYSAKEAVTTCSCNWYSLNTVTAVSAVNASGKIGYDENSASIEADSLVIANLFMYHLSSSDAGTVIQNSDKIMKSGLGLLEPSAVSNPNTKNWACYALAVQLSDGTNSGGVPNSVGVVAPTGGSDSVPVPVYLMQEMLQRQDVLTLFKQAIREIGCGPVQWPDYYVEPKQEITYWPAFVSNEMSKVSNAENVYGDTYSASSAVLTGHVQVHVMGVKGQVNVMRGQIVANIYDNGTDGKSQGAFHRVLTPGAFVRVELLGCLPFVTDSYHLHDNPVPLLNIADGKRAYNVDLTPSALEIATRSEDIMINAADTCRIESVNKSVGVNQTAGGLSQENRKPQ
jgi:hypothetical protein